MADGSQACGWLQPLGRSLDVLLRHLPLGSAWLAYRLPGKRAYRMMTALADTFEDAWSFLCGLAAELNPYTTYQMLPDWETAVGLPDPCLPAATTIDQRRAQVVFRLTKKRWVTVNDWADLAALFGLTIAVTPGYLYSGSSGFPSHGRFRVYINVLSGCGTPDGFDYNFDYPWDVIPPMCFNFVCIIERIAPANVVVFWNGSELVSS